eukprot:6023101-Pyramimonas_sp.AAC.1
MAKSRGMLLRGAPKERSATWQQQLKRHLQSSQHWISMRWPCQKAWALGRRCWLKRKITGAFPRGRSRPDTRET